MKAVFSSAGFDFDSPFLLVEGNLGRLPSLGTKVQPVQFESSLHIFWSCCLIRQGVKYLSSRVLKPHAGDVYCERIMTDYLQRIMKRLTEDDDEIRSLSKRFFGK